MREETVLITDLPVFTSIYSNTFAWTQLPLTTWKCASLPLLLSLEHTFESQVMDRNFDLLGVVCIVIMFRLER